MFNSIYEISIKPQNENSQKIIYLVLKVLRYAVLVVSAIVLSLAFFIDNGFWLVLLFCILVFVFLSILQSNVYNFYEYSLVSDQITVSKIINNCKRKNLITFCVKNIVEIGKIDGDNYFKHLNDKSIKKIDALNGVVYNGDYYVLIELNGERKLLLLRLDKKMLSIILKYNVLRLIEKDFKEILNNHG